MGLLKCTYSPLATAQKQQLLVNVRVIFVTISVFRILPDFSKTKTLWEVKLQSSIVVHLRVSLAKYEEIRFQFCPRILCALKRSIASDGTQFHFVPAAFRSVSHDGGTTSQVFEREPQQC